MSPLEDLLREAYGEERFRVTVTEIEARARRARHRRVTLAVAGGLAAALAVVFVAVPRMRTEAPAASASAHPCREEMAGAGTPSLLAVEPIEISVDGGTTYLFGDGTVVIACRPEPGDGRPVRPGKSVTPLLRTTLDYTSMRHHGEDLVFGPVPRGIREFVHFGRSGSDAVKPLASNGTVFFGYVPGAWDPSGTSFNGVMATGERALIAHASWRPTGPLDTPETQESACRSTEQLMPVPHIPLTTLDIRRVGEAAVILLTGAAGMLAVCTILRDRTAAQVSLTIANRPIYETVTGVVLMQAPPDHGGAGDVVLSDGRKVPLAFDKGYATAVLDLPDDVQPDHVEVELAAGGRTVYP